MHIAHGESCTETTFILAIGTEGHVFGVDNMRVVAAFDEGRIAQKSFTISMEYTGAEGEYYNYTTHTSLMARR